MPSLTWWPGRRGWLLLAVAAVVVQSAWTRAGGLDPNSLWVDDLVYAAIIKNPDLLGSLSVPIHVAPGLFMVWRWLYAWIPDLELSLQALPFSCSLVAIPAMALVVRNLTHDDALAAGAAAVTALNNMLAFYSTAVHQYTFDFLATAIVLWLTTRLYETWPVISLRRFAQVALWSAMLPFFSAPSIFLTAPIVAGTAAYAVVNGRARLEGLRTRVILIAAAYGAAVIMAYLVLRGRSNAAVRADFADGFMPVDSLAAVWGFLAVHGTRLLEASLPGIQGGLAPWDGTFVWLMPCLGLGLIWLIARIRTRPFGLVVVAFYLVFLAASALRVYPLGVLGLGGRTDIFAFPVGICLLMVGLQCATESLPKAGRFRVAVAAAAIVFALWVPHYAPYRDTRSMHLIDYIAVNEQPKDGVILTYAAGFLAAVYGPWPFTIVEDRQIHNGTIAQVERPRTLRLPYGTPSDASRSRTGLRRFLAAGRPDRIWFVNYRPADWDGIDALKQQGYLLHDIGTEAREGRLYLALDLGARRDISSTEH